MGLLNIGIRGRSLIEETEEEARCIAGVLKRDRRLRNYISFRIHLHFVFVRIGFCRNIITPSRVQNGQTKAF